MKNNIYNRIMIATYIVIAIFSLLVLRLWQLQILQGNEYRKISEENRLKIVKIAAPRGIIYDRNGIPLVKNSPYYSVSISPALSGNIDAALLSKVIDIDIDTIKKKLSNKKSSFEPVRLKEGLSFKEIAFIEARRSDFPGLYIDIDVTRHYLFGEVGAHLIGYIGKLNQRQYRDSEFRGLPADAFVGQWGIEMLFDKQLRGIPGERIVEVDALGRELRLITEKPPTKGKDLTIAMDINLQKAAEEAFGEKTGALVAIKPDTGEILSLVSKPSFDPNLFAKGISQQQWTDLIYNPRNPLLNRALQSQYPPGSTFKIVTALAGLEEHVIDPETKVTCNGGISYGRWHFGCWLKNGHKTLTLHRALVESCDVYFYEVGRRLGIDRVASYARGLGLGKNSNLRLVNERKGVVPDTKWKQEQRKQPWYLGDTFHASIGQGYVAVTPYQMARLTGIISSGGCIYEPSLLKLEEKPLMSKKLNVSFENISEIKKGLYGVVNEPSGTGWAARSSIVEICGKTGTAQVVGIRKDSRYLHELHRDHAWFVAFAPCDKPEVALSVLVEHGGHGGAAAAPIAKRAIEAYLRSLQKSRRVEG